MLALIALAIAPASTAPQIAVNLEATRGFSRPDAVTGTPDGKYIFSSEGASIAIIEPGAGTAPDPNFNIPLKRFQLGKFCPHVVRMVLDPHADLDNGESLAADGSTGYANYLFLAAGPNGLWIADADKSTGVVNKVARVDDSAGASGNQGSQRHCNDVDVLVFDDDAYVVATFAKKSHNRLRFYKLDDVRAVLGASNGTAGETGSEIPPLVEVNLGGHPSVSSPSALQIARSFASDLVVDPFDPTASETYVYVAMRTDGIVRIRVRKSELQAGSLSAGSVVWGPIFGSTSHYAMVPPPPPFGDERGVYTNFDWVNQQHDPDRIERSDPPYFTALAVHRDTPDGTNTRHGHKLYVGVDPIGFVVFDVEDPASWGPTMPVDHHEGAAIDLQGNAAGPLTNPGAWDERIVVPKVHPGGAGAVRDLIGYVRALDVVDTGEGLQLIATYSSEPSIADSPPFLEGFAYEDRFQYGGVTYIVQTKGTQRGFTMIYAVGDFQDASPTTKLTQNIELIAGGTVLFVPPVQSNQMGATTGTSARLEFIHGLSSGDDPALPGTMQQILSVCMTSLRLDTPGTLDVVQAIRDREFVTGRRTFGLGQSLIDPNLIMTADNDGPPRDGVPYLTGAPGSREIMVDYDTTAPAGNDERLATGVIFGRRSQWTSGLSPGQQAVVGNGKPNPNLMPREPSTHEVVVQTIPPSMGGSPSIAEKTVNLKQAPDRWDLVPRSFYLGGMVDTRYDAWVQANHSHLGAAEYLFLFRQGTPDGVVYGRRDALTALVSDPQTPDGAYVDYSVWDSAGFNGEVLNTHPEFDDFPWQPSDTGFPVAAAWFQQPAAVPHPYRDRVKTWEPEMLQVLPRSGSPFDEGWVLAVPCGVSVLDNVEYPDVADVGRGPGSYERLDEITVGGVPGDPDWLPDAGSESDVGFEKGLVQFWDFTDPSSVPPGPTGSPVGSSSLPRIYIPIAAAESQDPRDVGRSSFAWHLEGLEVGTGTELRSFVIVGDFIGGVHLYEVTSILSGVAPILRDSWYPPLSKQDLLTNNVRDVVVDRWGSTRRAYIAVQRVGVVVLDLVFDTEPSQGVAFLESGRLTDLKEPLTLHLRQVDGGDERLLYVCDHRQALRVYSSE